MPKGIWVILSLTACCSPVYAMSERIVQCSEMSVAAYNLVDARDRQTEQEASKSIKSYGLTPKQIEVLEGLIGIVYSRQVDALFNPKGPPSPFSYNMPSPGEVAVAMYAACAAR